MVFFLCSVSAQAAAQLTLTADKQELQPGEKVKVLAQEFDENGQMLTNDVTILVKISKGGLTQSKILKDGLILKCGVGEFTFIAPTKAGSADIFVIDPVTNLSAKLSLKVTEDTTSYNWKKEYAVITKIKGKAAFQKAGQPNWDAALTNVQLHEGDSIRTWDKSYVTIQLFDGSEITLQPFTTLYIKFLKSSLDNVEVKQSVFKVFTGQVLCSAKKYIEKGSKFEIETESSAAGIRGTYFEFVSTADGASELLVYEGAVVLEYFEQGMLFLVEGGQKLTLQPGTYDLPDVVLHEIKPEDRQLKLDEEMKEEEPVAPVEEITEEEEVTEEKPVDETEIIEEEEILEEEILEEQPVVEIPPVEQKPVDSIPTEKPATSGGPFSWLDWNKAKPSDTNLLFGSEQIDGKMYFTLNLQPEFKQILGSPLSVGLNLALYQDADSGQVGFAPNEEVKLQNIFNWVEWDGKYTYLRYGYMNNITYGYGLLMGKYSKPESRGFQMGLDNITKSQLGLRVLLPMDIKSLYPWETERTSTLYAARATAKFKFIGIPLQEGFTVVNDINPDLKMLPYRVPTSGMAADVSLPWLKIAQPYFEIAHLSEFGTGAELGVRGQLGSVIWYQSGLRSISDNFTPNYFGEDYEVYKKNSVDSIYAPVAGRGLPDLTVPGLYQATKGAYVKAGANLGIASLSIGYENYDNMGMYAPILTGELVASTPQIGGLPSVSGGVSYKQVQFGSYTDGMQRWLNRNTLFSYYVTFPINASVYATLRNTFIPSDIDIDFTQELGVSFPF